MMTVNEVSKLTGVSIRTLQYYDKIGLLQPAAYTESGYRLYDDAAMEKLQQITLLTMKKDHLENLILFARGIHGIGVKNMDFSVFDTKKMDEYAKQAKKNWGQTAEYKEFEEKQKGYTDEDNKKMTEEFMGLFAKLGQLKDLEPSSEDVQAKVKELQQFITEHFYTCTDEILQSLGKMYSGGGSMMENIDATGGDGTAQFVARAIDYYCKKP